MSTVISVGHGWAETFTDKVYILKQAFAHSKAFGLKNSFCVKHLDIFYGYVPGTDCVSQHKNEKSIIQQNISHILPSSSTFK